MISLKGTNQLVTSGFLKLSITEDSIERYKAQLITKGFAKQEGKYYDETFSHVMRLPLQDSS